MDVAVLGATSAGRALTEVCVRAGHTVSLHDDDANAVMDGIDAVEAGLGDAPGQLDGTTGLKAAVADVGVVAETVTRETSALQEVFATLESHATRDALFVTTAPAVSVTAAAAGLRHPDRAAGFRFRDLREVPLVEVVAADQTTAETCERAVSFVSELDRSPVVVRDAPGAAATRLALALEVEAMRLVSEEVAGVEDADESLRLGYDYPVGPLEQADRAGLTGRLRALEQLTGAFGERFEPPELLRERVADGKTGAAAGEGFYVWENGDPVESALPGPAFPRQIDGPDDPGA